MAKEVVQAGIILPKGRKGQFLITNKMLIETNQDLGILDLLLRQRAEEYNVSLSLQVESLREGVKVSWEWSERE